MNIYKNALKGLQILTNFKKGQVVWSKLDYHKVFEYFEGRIK